MNSETSREEKEIVIEFEESEATTPHEFFGFLD